MSRVGPLPSDALDAFVDMAANAYPGFNVSTAEDKQRWKENLKRLEDEDPTTHLYGLWRDDTLVGGMRYFDFTMRLFETTIPVGGVGLVWVDLLHKKEHIAKDLIAAFLRHYREQGAPMVSLYAFRHDFYKKMGFGYGTKMSQYRVQIGKLPRRRGKEHIVFLKPGDEDAMLACYQRVYGRTHGLFARRRYNFQRMLENQSLRFVGFRRDGELRGYLAFTFKPAKPDNAFVNDIHTEDMVYEDPEALAGLIAFLQAQADQINTWVHTTQDADFHHLPLDARDGSDNIYYISHQTNVDAMGIMYRIVDARAIFGALEEHSFNNQTLALRLNIEDSFLPENAQSLTLNFNGGYATIRDDGPHDVELTLDVAELSSLLMGAVRFRTLYDYGMLAISDPSKVDLLNRLFAVEHKPICMTRF